MSQQEGKARLQREAQAMAKLAHPNVVAVHDIGTVGEQLFIAMEYVDGQTLSAWAWPPSAIGAKSSPCSWAPAEAYRPRPPPL